MFAATAATIVSGAVAERVKLTGFMLYATILVAMVGAAVVGLLANPGPVQLPDARYVVPPPSKEGPGWVLELPAAAEELDRASENQIALLREAASQRLLPESVTGGAVRGRRVRLRDEPGKIVGLYSRDYVLGDGHVSQVSRLTVVDADELQEKYQMWS